MRTQMGPVPVDEEQVMGDDFSADVKYTTDAQK
jgi:hypothetical protein